MSTSTTRRASVTLALAVAAVAATVPASTAGPSANPNQQVALVNETGQQVEAKSKINGTAQVTSHDGRTVVFSTDAALVPQDDNGVDDIYLRDTWDDITILVSARDGVPGNDASFEPTISADGTRVAFTTWATNLAKDTNGTTLDVLVKDLAQDRIQRVSVTSGEKQTGKNSFFPVISGNGGFVSFQTWGHYGPKDDDTKEDVYVRDLAAGTTQQVSLLPGGGGDVRGSVLNGDLSDNGRKATFGDSNNLWVRNLATGRTIRFWHEPDSPPCQPWPAGSAGRPVISGNGAVAAFSSCATDLPGENGEFSDVYVIDLRSGDIVRAHPKADGDSYLPSLSRTGRYVGFGSDATNLVPSDDENQPDAFSVDRETGTVHRASETPDGTGGNSYNGRNSVAISGDGQTLVYTSYSSNLVPDDLFDLEEVLVWHL